MELVILMQRNLSGILSSHLQKPRVEQCSPWTGRGSFLETWKGGLVVQQAPPARWAFSLWKVGSCLVVVVTPRPKHLITMSWLGVMILNLLIPIPWFHWKVEHPQWVFLGMKNPVSAILLTEPCLPGLRAQVIVWMQLLAAAQMVITPAPGGQNFPSRCVTGSLTETAAQFRGMGRRRWWSAWVASCHLPFCTMKWSSELAEETWRQFCEIRALQFPQQFCKALRMIESAVLAQRCLCPTGSERALLNVPGIFVTGVWSCNEGRVTCADHK